jgi:hypothetical protein
LAETAGQSAHEAGHAGIFFGASGEDGFSSFFAAGFAFPESVA